MNRRHPIKQLSEQRRQDSSTPNGVASSQENARRLSGDLALARNCLSNLLFAESALDKELARREARRFLGHPPVEHAHETGEQHPAVVPETLVAWVDERHWRCRCKPPGDITIASASFCRACSTARPELKASEPWQNCRMLACQPNRRCMNSEDCQSRRPRSGHT